MPRAARNRTNEPSRGSFDDRRFDEQIEQRLEVARVDAEQRCALFERHREARDIQERHPGCV
jgi:hypothetical protein